MAETAVVVLVPELEPLVGDWNRRHTGAGARGMPPHLTLLYPFVDTLEIDLESEAAIVVALAPFRPFRLRFPIPATSAARARTIRSTCAPSRPTCSSR